MATKVAGGRITGKVALTLEATVALEVNDPVQVTDDYTCEKADGTLPIVGIVSVANKVRSGGVFPADQVPGDVTVEARGFAVVTLVAGAAITAGTSVGYNATSDLVTVGAGVEKVGIALMTVADGASVDVLLQ